MTANPASIHRNHEDTSVDRVPIDNGLKSSSPSYPFMGNISALCLRPNRVWRSMILTVFMMSRVSDVDAAVNELREFMVAPSAPIQATYLRITRSGENSAAITNKVFLAQNESSFLMALDDGLLVAAQRGTNYWVIGRAPEGGQLLETYSESRRFPARTAEGGPGKTVPMLKQQAEELLRLGIFHLDIDSVQFRGLDFSANFFEIGQLAGQIELDDMSRPREIRSRASANGTVIESSIECLHERPLEIPFLPSRWIIRRTVNGKELPELEIQLLTAARLSERESEELLDYRRYLVNKPSLTVTYSSNNPYSVSKDGKSLLEVQLPYIPTDTVHREAP